MSKLNAVEIFDANSAVLEYAWIARVVAKRGSKFDEGRCKIEDEDLEQVALVGMIEGSRKPMGDGAESFRHWMFICAYKAVGAYFRETESGRKREANRYATGKGGDATPFVELSADKRSRRPVYILAEDEWWGLITLPLSAEEKRFVAVRFREGFSIEDTAKQLDVSVFRVRELEATVLPVCGNEIKKLQGYENVGEVNVEVPSFRLRDAGDRNGRPVIDESTGETYPSLSKMAAAMGWGVGQLCRAVRHGGGEYQGHRIRYATDDEGAEIKRQAGGRIERIDYRSTAVIHVDTGDYYHSLNAAAAAIGLKETSLWKSMNMGKKKFELHGHRFRYATEKEVEARQCQQGAA